MKTTLDVWQTEGGVWAFGPVAGLRSPEWGLYPTKAEAVEAAAARVVEAPEAYELQAFV